MSDRALHAVEALIAAHGAPAIAVGAFVEGEVVVTLGGLAAHQGLIAPGLAFLCAFLGAYAYDQLVFALARSPWAEPLVARIRRLPGFDRAAAMVDRRPSLFVLSFRFVYGMRTAGAAAIAAAGVPHLRFVLLDGLAVAIWAGLFTGLGFFFGTAAEAAFGDLQRWEHRALVALGVVAALLLIRVALRWRRSG